MVKEKKNNYTNLKKALKNIGGKGSMKNKLITFFGGSLSNYLSNLCCVYEGIKSSLGSDKVVITGSAAVLLHALNAETEENYNNLSTLENLVSIVRIEDSGQFRITSDFDFLIVQKEQNINKPAVIINEFEYKRVQGEPGRSLTFESNNSSCPPFDISVRTVVQYNEITYNSKSYSVQSLRSLYDTYMDNLEHDNLEKQKRNENKLELLAELIEKQNLLVDQIYKIESEGARLDLSPYKGTVSRNLFGNNNNNNNNNNNTARKLF